MSHSFRKMTCCKNNETFSWLMHFNFTIKGWRFSSLKYEKKQFSKKKYIIARYWLISVLLYCALFFEVREACHEGIETKRARGFLQKRFWVLLKTLSVMPVIQNRLYCREKMELLGYTYFWFSSSHNDLFKHAIICKNLAF